jgi:hypothetical protein
MPRLYSSVVHSPPRICHGAVRHASEVSGRDYGTERLRPINERFRDGAREGVGRRSRSGGRYEIRLTSFLCSARNAQPEPAWFKCWRSSD